MIARPQFLNRVPTQTCSGISCVCPNRAAYFWVVNKAKGLKGQRFSATQSTERATRTRGKQFARTKWRANASKTGKVFGDVLYASCKRRSLLDVA